MNLKLVLMELGNKLVLERHWLPGQPYDADSKNSTQPIIEFVHFLNENPDAIEVLQEMGIEWPVVSK